MKNIKALLIVGAAGLALAGGTVAGASSQDTPDVAAPNEDAPLSIDARQAKGLAEYAASHQAEPIVIGSVTTDTATIKLTRIVRGGDTVSLCTSVLNAAGGGSQGCRLGAKLTEPLVSVSRDTDGSVVVTGLAPGAEGSSRIVDGTGREIAGSQTRATARAGVSLGYQPVSARIKGEANIGLSYTDGTGTQKVQPLAGTLKALDAN